MQSLLSDFLTNFKCELNPDFYNYIDLLRKDKQDIMLESINLLDYKKCMLDVIKTTILSSAKDDVVFTDEELSENKIISPNNGMKIQGMKITKYLHNLMDRYNPKSSRQIIDIMNKPRKERNLRITWNPETILRAYSGIDTCMSPGGSNVPAVLQNLVSKYFCMVVDEDLELRMSLFFDEENKIVFLFPVYGDYDYHIVLTVYDFCKKNGYRIMQDINPHCSFIGCYYNDSLYTSHEIPEFYSDLVLSKNEYLSDFNKKVLYLEALESYYKYNIDIITSEVKNAEDYKLITTSDLCDYFQENLYCEFCDEYHDLEDYDVEHSICYDCKNVEMPYCEQCDERHWERDYNRELDMCLNCSNDFILCECGRIQEKEEMDDCFEKVCNTCYHEKYIDLKYRLNKALVLFPKIRISIGKNVNK